MPGKATTTRTRRKALTRFDPWCDPGAMLVVIDEAPLKRAAWAELHAVRKRQEKAARELHRHEEIDRPAFDSWLHRTFPILITRLRELHEEVFAKAQKVEAVQAMAMSTGRSPSKLWQELQERDWKPEAFEAEGEDGRDEGGRPQGRPFWEQAEDFEEEPEFGEPWEIPVGAGYGQPNAPRQSVAARDVYRRLVQRIHPDSGGEWTAARQRLWHEVQQAWAAGDTDWLTRLEVEWEATHDVLSIASPLSRLRAAIEELHAARRDLERKLRAYRETPPWRFSLALKKRDDLHRRSKLNFEHDIAFLQRQLEHLNALIASWEERPGARRRRHSRSVEIRFFE